MKDLIKKAIHKQKQISAEATVLNYTLMGKMFQYLSVNQPVYNTLSKVFLDPELHTTIRAILPELYNLGLTPKRFKHNQELVKQLINKLEKLYARHNPTPKIDLSAMIAQLRKAEHLHRTDRSNWFN